MTTVDSEGRIRLPEEIRERLDMTPGTEVEVREKDGKAVVEPENSPGEILERMDQLVEEASPSREEAAPPLQEADSSALKHTDVVQRHAENHSDE